MERNVGFFEAWRAKRRQKKNEESEKLSGERSENGILQKYLKLRSEGLLGTGGFNEEKKETDKPANADSEILELEEKTCESSTASVSAAHSSRNENVKRNSTENFQSLEKGGFDKSSSKATWTERRKSFEFKSPSGSRRSSFDSRHGSISSPFGSVLDIQEKLLTLSKEQNGVPSRKPFKVNKLNENSLRIGKTSANGQKEEIKIPGKILKREGDSGAAEGKGIISKTGGKAIKTSSSGKSSEKDDKLKIEKIDKNDVGGPNALDNTKDLKSIFAIKTQETLEFKEKAKAETHNLLELDEIPVNKMGFKPIKTEPKISCEKPLPEVKKPQPLKEIIETASSKGAKAEASVSETIKASSVCETISSLETDKAKKCAALEMKKQTSPNTTKVKSLTKVKPEKPDSITTKNSNKLQESLTEDLKVKSETKIITKSQNVSSKSADTKTQSDVLKTGSCAGVTKLKDDSKTKIETKTVKSKIPLSKDGKSQGDARSSQLTIRESGKVNESKTAQNTSGTRLENETRSSSVENKLIKEARSVREHMTVLTDRMNQIETELPETNIVKAKKNEESETVSNRKDSEKALKKLKLKHRPDESFPKTQKLLTGKSINAFEEVKLEESKSETTVSPRKVEAFLREALSPPIILGGKEPMKMMEAVVEEIVTNKSEQSKYEKPSQARYSSKGEVICGVVSIKPSNAVEETESLSAISLVPAFRPPKSILEKDTEKRSEQTSDYFSDTENTKMIEKMVEIPEVPESDDRNLGLRKEKSFSPLSDFSDDSYDHYVASADYSLDSSCSRRRFSRSFSTPRRIFPQVAISSPYRFEQSKEEFPVVFDAGLSFDLSSNRGSLRHHFKPQPAFTDIKTTSSFLSLRIADFLKRTDHIMEEWRHFGKGGDDLQSLVQLPSSSVSGSLKSKRKSATNIMIKGLLNYSKGSRTPSLRSRSAARTIENTDRTISDIDELSEMTLDLSEERASGMMQAERLEAETAERVRLEQEVAQIQNEKKNLQQTSERLEMELFYARAEVNGLSESEADFEDGNGDAALYKNKCERAMRELEFTRRRLQQQHEDDLEQLVGLKKQLEKKLTDAYEEVEEQRQVAAQWKRKVQKLQSETNDLRLLLEEQSSRNNMLEKKQRKFDSEIQMLQEELRSERSQKERLSREKEMAVAEKYSLEQNLSSVRLELELKEEKVSALTRELEELPCGGGTEQEVTQLRKAKHDLEMKLKDQEEELDELAGQVSMLEGNKLRLEMSLESLRKEHRREMAARDDELDEVRANAQKKIKVLESQLESEHEERTLLVREKHELERRLADAEDRVRHHRAADEEALQRARRDLKKTKALLRDAQVMLERAKQDSPTKAALRALKNQLEDAELARASAVKAKQSLEAELNEVMGQLEETLRAKGDAENRCQAALREMNSLRTQVDENEEELAELLKKYRQTVQQLSAEQLANQETAGALAEAEAERASLRDQLAEMTARLEANTTVDPTSGLAQKKLEIRIKELESRLELEQTTRGRLEVQITRLKENVERLNEECVQARTKEQAATDLTRKLQRSLRETKEQLAGLQAKDQEAIHKRKELEKRLETAEQEASTARTDLRLAVKRIEDLQSAISGEIGSDSERSASEEEDSGDESLISHVPSTISSGSRVSRTPELTPR